MTSTWHYYGSCKLVALELHNSCSYIVVFKLHELHMYIVSHTMNCIHCSSCNLFNSTHTCRKYVELQWIVNELQMVIATQKPSCKVSCKSLHFLIVQFDDNIFTCVYFFLYHINIMLEWLNNSHKNYNIYYKKKNGDSFQV
jgi:hypothetical protein